MTNFYDVHIIFFLLNNSNSDLVTVRSIRKYSQLLLTLYNSLDTNGDRSQIIHTLLRLFSGNDTEKFSSFNFSQQKMGGINMFVEVRPSSKYIGMIIRYPPFRIELVNMTEE